MTTSVQRPPKMARLVKEECAGSQLLRDLAPSFKEKIAGYLAFPEASYFAGKQLSFSTWLKSREGIDDADGWSSRKNIGDNKWDRFVFPRILRKIESDGSSSWLKKLSFTDATHGQLAKFSTFKFPYVERLHLNFSSRELHKPSVVLERAVAGFGKNCPRLAHVSISLVNERECLLLLEHCKTLVSLKILNIDYLPDPQNPKSLSRWNWKNVAQSLAKIPTLKAVYLHNKIVDCEVEDVAKIPQLRSLFFFQDPKINDAALAPLVACEQLEEVGLRNLPSITGKTLEMVLGLPRLTFLSVENCECITGVGNSVPKEVRSLRRLALTTCKYADKILRFLPACSSLARVKLTDCTGLSDKGFSLLGKCTQLRDLEVSKGSPSISDKGLLLLAQCPLQFLRLKIASVGDRKAEQAAWKNVTIIGVRQFVEKSPQLRLFETALSRVVISFKHTDNELLQDALLRSPHSLEVAFLY